MTCDPATSEQRLQPKEEVWGSNSPERGGNGEQILGREDVLSQPEGQRGGWGGRGQTRRREAEIQVRRGGPWAFCCATGEATVGLETWRQNPLVAGQGHECRWPAGDRHHGEALRSDDAETSTRGGVAEGS